MVKRLLKYNLSALKYNNVPIGVEIYNWVTGWIESPGADPLVSLSTNGPQIIEAVTGDLEK